MMKELFDVAMLDLIDYILEYPSPGFTQQEVITKMKTGAWARKAFPKALENGLDLGIIFCKTPDAAPEAKLYVVNDRSPLLSAFLKLEVEATKQKLDVQKRRLRDAYTYSKEKPALSDEPKEEKNGVEPGA